MIRNLKMPDRVILELTDLIAHNQNDILYNRSFTQGLQSQINNNKADINVLFYDLSNLQSQVDSIDTRFFTTIVSTTTDYTLSTNRTLVLADSSAGSFTITLHLGIDKAIVGVKKVDDSTNPITIVPSSSDITIDGESSYIHDLPDASITMVYDASNKNWVIF